MKTLVLMTVAAGLLLTVAARAQAATADECIAEYESLKSQFEAAAPDATPDCVTNGPLISLDAEGPLPDFCQGSWDHWHLEASATGINEGVCKMMLRGLENVPGCGTEALEMALPANEAAAWRNYLRGECR